MNYKKNIFTLLASAFFAILPFAANAASISLSPPHISVNVGQAFSVATRVDTSGAAVYTVKLEERFTPSILSLSTWSFSSQWMAVRQPGYDSFDNSQGILIRTAGYPGGFNGLVLLGNATFIAQKIGKAFISVNPNSLIYNEANENIYTGANEVVVDVLPVAAKPNLATTSNQVAPKPTAVASTVPPQIRLPDLGPPPSVNAQAGPAAPQGTNYWYMAIAAITAAAALVIFYITRKKSQKK